MTGRDVCVLLSPEEVDANVLGDLVKPCVKYTLASEAWQCEKCLCEHVLGDVFGQFFLADMLINEGIDFGRVFDNEGVKRLCVTVLCALDEYVFVGVCLRIKRIRLSGQSHVHEQA